MARHVAVILTGGPSKSLGLVLPGRSRSLAPLAGETLLSLIADAVSPLVEEVMIVYDDPRVPEEARGCSNCTYVEQAGEGIEAALCSAVERLGEKDLATIVYGDIYSEEELYRSHVREAFTERTPLITLTRPHKVRAAYKLFEVDEEGRVASIGRGSLVHGGLFTASASLLRDQVCRESKTLTQLLASLAEEKRLHAHLWLGTWIDIDTPWDYLVAVRDRLSRMDKVVVEEGADIASTAVVEGPAYVARGARIDSYAVVRGPAYIGRGVLIGAHSFVRTEVAVHDDAVVGAYAEVKRSIVLYSARVNSHTYIADSIIGEAAEVAPFTVTVNTPYTQVPVEADIILSTTLPAEKIKIGAIISARTRVEPHTTLSPGQVYSTPTLRGRR